jgi:hypothetical protein
MKLMNIDLASMKCICLVAGCFCAGDHNRYHPDRRGHPIVDDADILSAEKGLGVSRIVGAICCG